MKRTMIVAAAGLALMLMGIGTAQSQPSNSGSQKVENTKKVSDTQEDQRKEEERKREEARLEEVKRKQIEHQKRQEADKAAREKEEARRAQERKDQEQKEQARKAEEDKRKEEERKAEEDRIRELSRKADDDRRREDDHRKEEARRADEDRKRDEDRRRDEARKADDEKRAEEARRSEEEKRKAREAWLERRKIRKIEREEAARREAERRDYDVIYYPPAPDPVIIVVPDSSGSVPELDPGPYTPQPPRSGDYVARAPDHDQPPIRYVHEPEPPKSYVGVVFAPGSGERKPAVGLQFLSRGLGIAAWFSGSLAQDDDVIPGIIPHNDYYTTSQVGTYGLEALCYTGSDAAMLMFGAGISVKRTLYTDISNATGYAWDGGEENEVKPAAMIGARLRLGGRVSMQIGYDTTQRTFFGLSAGF